MTEINLQHHQQELKKQLWNIANTLRGNMSADDFRDYILGLIFYKYLSDKLNRYADGLLSEDKLAFAELNSNTEKGKAYLEAVKECSGLIVPDTSISFSYYVTRGEYEKYT